MVLKKVTKIIKRTKRELCLPSSSKASATIVASGVTRLLIVTRGRRMKEGDGLDPP